MITALGLAGLGACAVSFVALRHAVRRERQFIAALAERMDVAARVARTYRPLALPSPAEPL